MRELKLLKQTKKVEATGKTYHNLFIQIDGGHPIAIDLVHFNWKVKNLLLANAEEFSVEEKVVVEKKDAN